MMTIAKTALTLIIVTGIAAAQPNQAPAAQVETLMREVKLLKLAVHLLRADVIRRAMVPLESELEAGVQRRRQLDTDEAQVRERTLARQRQLGEQVLTEEERRDLAETAGGSTGTDGELARIGREREGIDRRAAQLSQKLEEEKRLWLASQELANALELELTAVPNR